MGTHGLRMTATPCGRYIQVMPKPVPIGTRGEAETTVQFKNTLTAWKEHLPSVYSTPNMIGMMEAAAYSALEPFCEGDEVSVGTAIHVVHRAPAVVGQTIKTEAILEAFDGRFYIFKVSAWNQLDVIGYGTIGRATHGIRRKDSLGTGTTILLVDSGYCSANSSFSMFLDNLAGGARSGRVFTSSRSLDRSYPCRYRLKPSEAFRVRVNC